MNSIIRNISTFITSTISRNGNGAFCSFTTNGRSMRGSFNDEEDWG